MTINRGAAVRLAVRGDAAAIAAIYAPAVTDGVASFELEAPNAAEMGDRVERTLQRLPWLVCEDGGAVVGYAYASRHRERAGYQWTVEVSAYVASTARGRGVARALYTALLDILVVQGFRNAYAGITLPNEPSVRLHEALGFTGFALFRGVGYKHGAWHDVAWYERMLRPRDARPSPPVALPSLLDSSALRSALDAGTALLRDGRAD